MRTEEKTNQPLFKLSGNNSQLTLANGKVFNINIEGAFNNFIYDLPKDFELPETRTEILGILDDFTQHMPIDYPMGRYKNIYALLNALASFHHGLLLEKKGGNND